MNKYKQILRRQKTEHFSVKRVLIRISPNWLKSSKRPIIKANHPSLNFNNKVVTQSTTYKYLGMIFDIKLDFQALMISLVKYARQ